MAVILNHQYKRSVIVSGTCLVYLKRKEESKRTIWVKRYREEFNDVHLVRELRENYPEDYRNYMRMDSNTFDLLLSLVKDNITKQDTVMRSSISAEQCLTATLRFLATGRSFEELKFTTGISRSSLSEVIPETCKALFEVLQKQFLKFPTTKKEWREIAKGFEDRWQFVNCGGAIDGKHIRIVPPPHSGAYFYNYKNYYSIVLMAVVSWNYEFIFIDVGQNGRISDGGIIENTTFNSKLNKKLLHLPEDNENVKDLSFVFLGDEAFALKDNLLKPYPQHDLDHDKRIFNYRLSRARNVVENTFGIVASRFKVLHTPINMKVKSICYVVFAICALHNFLQRKTSTYITSTTVDREDLENMTFQDGEWKNNGVQLHGLQLIPSKNCVNSAKKNRDAYKEYFCSEGSVPWQEEMLKLGRA